MALIGQAVSEKKIFENGGRRRTPDHGHPISSPYEPNGSGELKIDLDILCPSYIFMANLFIDYIDAILNDVLIFDVIKSKAPEFVGH